MKIFLLHSLIVCSLFANAQKRLLPFDSIRNKQVGIKEELIQLKAHHYYIRPTGSAGNIGIFNGKNRLLLIDDQWGILTDRIKGIIKKVTPRKPSFIINTGFHFDHTNGNTIWGAENIPIIAHENSRIRMQKDRELSVPLPLIQKAYPSKALPSITFIERMQLYDELETIELTHVKNAHTDGDIIIQFKQANIFYTGDLFVRDGLPPIDENNGGDIYGLIHAMNYLINVANEQSIIVPGHGSAAGLKEVRAYRDLITGIRNKIIQLARQKKTEEEIVSEMETFITVAYTSVSKKAFTLHTLRMVQKHERI